MKTSDLTKTWQVFQQLPGSCPKPDFLQHSILLEYKKIKNNIDINCRVYLIICSRKEISKEQV